MSLQERVGTSYKTIMEMLADRQILTDEEMNVLKGFSSNELVAFASTSRQIFNLDIGDKVRIIYYLNKFKTVDFKPFVEGGDFKLYIVVVAEKLTTNNMKTITEFEKNSEVPLVMQFFELRELQFNITKHVLVPKHEVIADEETINALVEKYNIRSRIHFPLILKSDPVAKYYGIKSGHLVKITRPSPSSGEYITYRCCV